LSCVLYAPRILIGCGAFPLNGSLKIETSLTCKLYAKMECPICFSNNATYVIQCGSKTPHTICHECEATMRMKVKPTAGGRMLKCPMCRTKETKQGKRSALSYDYELSKVTTAMKIQVYQERIRDRWEILADMVRRLPKATQETYIHDFPAIRPYL
jgi:hypothetical protein